MDTTLDCSFRSWRLDSLPQAVTHSVPRFFAFSNPKQQDTKAKTGFIVNFKQQTERQQILSIAGLLALRVSEGNDSVRDEPMGKDPAVDDRCSNQHPKRPAAGFPQQLRY